MKFLKVNNLSAEIHQRNNSNATTTTTTTNDCNNNNNSNSNVNHFPHQFNTPAGRCVESEYAQLTCKNRKRLRKGFIYYHDGKS